MFIYLSFCLSIYLSYLALPYLVLSCLILSYLIYLQAGKRSYFATLPQFSNLVTSKTQQFYETSIFFELDNVKNEKKSARRCETSSFFEVDNIKNEASSQDFLQKWKVECRPDGLVPMHFAIFPLHLSKVLRLPQKSEARS